MGSCFEAATARRRRFLLVRAVRKALPIPIGSHNHPSTTEVSPVFVFARQLNRTVRRSLISLRDTQMRTD
jgi:hypothetical protein